MIQERCVMPGMRLFFGLLAVVILSSLRPVATEAQASQCTTLVEEAISAVSEVCTGGGRNEACYGNLDIVADPREGADDFVFETIGDRVPVAAINRLELAALDETASVWGIAVLRLQADIADTLPGENVLFVAFGSVEIENEVETPLDIPLIEVEAVRGLNLRALPDDEAQIVGGLSASERITADARSDNGNWLRVQTGEGETAWLWAANVTAVEGDVSTLVVVDPLAATASPMQVFRMRSGLSEPACADAPPDGVMLQTPVNVQVTFTVNGVEIRLGSTVFIQAAADIAMRVYVVEGQARVTADGASVYVPAGTFVTVPMDEDLLPTDAPSELLGYDEADLTALPIALLDRQIVIAAGLTEEQIAAAISSEGAQAQTVPATTTTTTTGTEWRSRPSDPPCQTGGDFVCIRFSDGYYWLYNSAQLGAVLGWESDTYNGQPVEVAVLTSGYRLAHVLNTDLVRGPY
jgi:uncharacterized protein YgiM (DUF1202 family)